MRCWSPLMPLMLPPMKWAGLNLRKKRRFKHNQTLLSTHTVTTWSNPLMKYWLAKGGVKYPRSKISRFLMWKMIWFLDRDHDSLMEWRTLENSSTRKSLTKAKTKLILVYAGSGGLLITAILSALLFSSVQVPIPHILSIMSHKCIGWGWVTDITAN